MPQGGGGGGGAFGIASCSLLEVRPSTGQLHLVIKHEERGPCSFSPLYQCCREIPEITNFFVHTYMYMDTNPITLPCSLASVCNNPLIRRDSEDNGSQ